MEWIEMLRSPEIRLGDFLFPWVMVMGAIGFVLALFLTSVIERVGLTRGIWHLPVFFVGLVVLVGCGLGLILAP